MKEMLVNQQLTLALAIFATILFAFVLYYKETPFVQLPFCQPTSIEQQPRVDSKSEQECLADVLTEIKICLLTVLSQSVSPNWLIEAQQCSSKLTKALQIKELKNKDESKYVLLPSDDEETECTVVTFGVGNDTEPEKQLRVLLPSCKFYGADPIYQSGAIYKELGQYYQTAVGGSRGVFTASVLEEGSYKGKSVNYITFEDFLVMTNITFVDYLFMDAEGGEYGMLKYLEKAKLRQMKNGEGIGGVCQINVEFHMSLQEHDMTLESFNKMFLRFILASDYVPLIAEGNFHFRTMWIDAANPKCVSKYFPSLCKYVSNVTT